MNIDPKFIKNLTNWLDTSDQKSAKYLYENRLNLPPFFRKYSKPLYRGTIVNDKFLEEIERKPISLNEYTSWSKDQSISISFLKDPKYRVTKKEGTQILITKTFTERDIIMDIQAYALFSGETTLLEHGLDKLAIDSALKESEVLIKKGILITKKDIKGLK